MSTKTLEDNCNEGIVINESIMKDKLINVETECEIDGQQTVMIFQQYQNDSSGGEPHVQTQVDSGSQQESSTEKKKQSR